MNYGISIPILISLFAFLYADEENILFQRAVQRSLLIPDKTSIRDRLSKLGKYEERDYENFRISQLVFFLTALSLCSLFALLGIIEIGVVALLIILTIFAIHLITERNLSNRCARRNLAIESEFPAVVEMLTLSVGAGESAATAMKRISQRANGYLASEFKIVVTEVERGRNFATAIDAMSKRVDSNSIRRFTDSLIISLSRGTPLVETLTHTANESRNQERIRILTAAGKSEISMMIPVVFLILPISILFALFPSLTSLNLFSG